MTLAAVVVDGVSKTFRISKEPTHSLKERLVRLARLRRAEFEEFAALGRLDLAIDVGQTVGILGHNGSGKSTLLKCVAGILTPSTGSVRVRGRLTSLLELGAGFHPDLSGRDNVYVNAAFYGMGRKQIGKVFDDIVDFAELARFIDEPVKHYSSGMYVRLGFAVAVNLDPDVLLVDEVLAVGDEEFQEKCLSRIKQFQAEGRTIVFVTHDADTVRRVCDRAVVLDHGRMVADDTPAAAVAVLREHLRHHAEDAGGAATGRRQPPGQGVLHRIELGHDPQREQRPLAPGEPLVLRVHLRPTTPIRAPVLTIEVGDRTGRPLFHADTDQLGQPLAPIDGPQTTTATLRNVYLLDGRYPVSLKLTDGSTGEIVDWRERAVTFTVARGSLADGVVAFDVTVE